MTLIIVLDALSINSRYIQGQWNWSNWRGFTFLSKIISYSTCIPTAMEMSYANRFECLHRYNNQSSL